MPANRKNKNLYLYGAVLCFLSIIAIFVIDGYLGIYDFLYVRTMQWERKIELESRWEDYKPEIYARWGEPIYFSYEIDNRTVSTYSTTLQVTLWEWEKKKAELFHEDISIAPFNKKNLTWVLNTNKLEQPLYETAPYRLKIKHGSVEIDMGLVITRKEAAPSPVR